METCSSCGTALAPNQILYTPNAKVICAACNDKADLVDTDKRAASNIVKAAWGSLGAGAISLIAPLALMSIITYLFVAVAILSAGFAIKSMEHGGDNDRFTKYLSGGQRIMVWVCSGIGVLLAGATALGYANKLAFYVM